MKEKLEKWMSGRYGADELSKACIAAALICIILSWFFFSGCIDYTGSGGNRSVLFQNVVKEYYGQTEGESEVPEAYESGTAMAVKAAEGYADQKNPSYLPLSGMRAANPDSAGQGQDMHNLSEV